MGAILGQEGDSLQALYHSFEADPRDPQTIYGLARIGLRKIPACRLVSRGRACLDKSR